MRALVSWLRKNSVNSVCLWTQLGNVPFKVCFQKPERLADSQAAKETDASLIG